MTISSDQNRNELLAKISILYYENDLNQQNIADKIGISRSMISRMLKEAKEKGIVEVKINYPWKTSPQLEKELEDSFNLSKAIVLSSGQENYESTVAGLGVLAANYFDSIIHDSMTIGISWGSALYQMINNIRKPNYQNLRVVQFVGATGSENPPIHGPFLAQNLSSRLNADCNYLFAPAIVSTDETKRQLMNDPTIIETFHYASKCDIAFVGIGTTNEKHNSMIKVGYLNFEELKSLREAGAVGDICLSFYSLCGDILRCDICNRTIAIPINRVRSIPNVVGVAGGNIKAKAIYGALHNQLINTLITDDHAAKEVLLLKDKLDC